MPDVDLESQSKIPQHPMPQPEQYNSPSKLEGQPVLLNRDFLLSVIDPVPLFCPINTRRVVGWMFMLGLVPLYIYLDDEYQLSTNINETVNRHFLPLMIFFFAYEPVILSIAMLFSRYPSDEAHNRFIQSAAQSSNPNLAIIIPCHNSADSIAQTVRSCLAHTGPERIFVMDNGKSEFPSDNTKEVVHAVHPDIRYFYLDKTANKTIALLVGALYIQEHHPEYTFSLIIDDDVIIPTTFTIRTELFDGAVKGIVYPIRADSPYKNPPSLVSYQDLEYQISDLEMAFLDRTKSVIRPHGAASLWDSATLVKVLYKHNAVFKGDDVMMGHILQHLHIAEGHAKLRIDMNCHFKTTTPQTYFGASPNLYQQRVRSWSEAQFLYPWNLSIKPLLTVWDRPPLALLSIKSSQLYNCYTQMSHITRIPIAVMLGNKSSFWLAILGNMMVQSALIMVFNHVKLPPRLRVDWYIASTYPLYKMLDGFMGTLAFLRAVSASRASAPDNPSIEAMLKKHVLTLPAPDASPKSPVRAAKSELNFFKKAPNSYTDVMIAEEKEAYPESVIHNTIQTQQSEEVKETEFVIQNNMQEQPAELNTEATQQLYFDSIRGTLGIQPGTQGWDVFLSQQQEPEIIEERVITLASSDTLLQSPEEVVNGQFEFYIKNSDSTSIYSEEEPIPLQSLRGELELLILYTLELRSLIAHLLNQEEQETEDLQQECTSLRSKLQEMELNEKKFQDLQQECATLRLRLQNMGSEITSHKKNMRLSSAGKLKFPSEPVQYRTPFVQEGGGYTPKMYKEMLNRQSDAAGQGRSKTEACSPW